MFWYYNIYMSKMYANGSVMMGCGQEFYLQFILYMKWYNSTCDKLNGCGKLKIYNTLSILK